MRAMLNPPRTCIDWASQAVDPHRAFIHARISQAPHLTQHGLKDELAARGVCVSHNAV